MDEVAALREENLHLSLAGECDDDDRNTDEVRTLMKEDRVIIFNFKCDGIAVLPPLCLHYSPRFAKARLHEVKHEKGYVDVHMVTIGCSSAQHLPRTLHFPHFFLPPYCRKSRCVFVLLKHSSCHLRGWSMFNARGACFFFYCSSVGGSAFNTRKVRQPLVRGRNCSHLRVVSSRRFMANRSRRYHGKRRATRCWRSNSPKS